MSPTLIVIAKAPAAGRSKTRLCPPCTAEQAAALAQAALQDTLAAVSEVPGRHLLALDGSPGDWLAGDFDVVPQVAGGLAERLAGAFAAATGPALLVGMDTPQLTSSDLRKALAALAEPGRDAVLGPAIDGGYWAIGLRRPDPRVFREIPMSTPWTLAAQRRRLHELCLRWAELAVKRDVDTFDDALAVAGHCPQSRFAAALAAMLGGDDAVPVASAAIQSPAP